MVDSQDCSVASHDRSRPLSKDTINQRIVKAQYAVRGALAIRAGQLEEELRNNRKAYPFSSIIYCNIGNPQQLGQPPLTFVRQVLSLVEYPALLDANTRPLLEQLYPSDVIERALLITNQMASIGAYSHSKGYEFVRKDVARFIEARDGGFPSDHNHIFLTNGASEGIEMVLKLIIASPSVGIMIPTPQYPLYSATITMLDGQPVPYPCIENSDWDISVASLSTALDKARSSGINVRAVCVINPGNPTGSCLAASAIRRIIRFCVQEGLSILADEVYQDNIYFEQDYPFVSFKKILREYPPLLIDA